MHAGFLGLRPCMLLLGGTVCVSGRAIVHSAVGPTMCSHCLQPYGIAWQRTQTFLIESSPSVSDSGRFSGKTAWCFLNLVHQQARVELVPTRTPLGGTGLKPPFFTFNALKKNHKCILYGCKNVTPLSLSSTENIQLCGMGWDLFLALVTLSEGGACRFN